MAMLTMPAVSFPSGPNEMHLNWMGSGARPERPHKCGSWPRDQFAHQRKSDLLMIRKRDFRLKCTQCSGMQYYTGARNSPPPPFEIPCNYCRAHRRYLRSHFLPRLCYVCRRFSFHFLVSRKYVRTYPGISGTKENLKRFPVTVKTNPRFGECYLFWVTKTGVVCILVIFQCV